MYIVFEGIDGSGKSTLIGNVMLKFPNAVRCREPGSTMYGEVIREWTLAKNLSDTSKLLMYLLSRSMLVQELDFSKVIFSDRGIVSTMAYNNKLLDQNDLLTLHKKLKLPLPDLVVYVHTPPAIALKRIEARGDEEVPALQELVQLQKNYTLALALIKKYCPVLQIANDSGQGTADLIQGLLKLGVPT